MDVIIDVGHGGIDGGTSTSLGVLEKDINLAIGKKLYYLLQKQSYNVGITRLDDYALSDDNQYDQLLSRHLKDLKQRKLIADTLKPKLFISLHGNWSESKKAKGPIVIYQPNNASYAVARIMQYHLNKPYGTQKLPRMGDKYFLMKHLKTTSVIVEMGYLSNQDDLIYLTKEETQNEIAAGLAEAIGEYLLLYP